MKKTELELPQGRPTVVTGGVRVVMSPGPTRLKPLVERVQKGLERDEGWTTDLKLTLHPGLGAPLRLTVADQVVETTVYGVPPRDGHTYAWAGRGSGMLIYFGAEEHNGHNVSIHVSPELLLDRDATTSLAGLRVLRAPCPARVRC